MDIYLIWNNFDLIAVVGMWIMSAYYLYEALRYDLPSGAIFVWGRALGCIALALFLSWVV